MPSQSNATSPIASGLSVLGVFEGRTPCDRVLKELMGFPANAYCGVIKLRLTLYQDPKTGTPTTYILHGTRKNLEGKWAIVKGTKTNPEAVVYQLDPDKPQGSLSFLKGDENILFILDKNRNLMVGNADFSYTLNRVEN